MRINVRMENAKFYTVFNAKTTICVLPETEHLLHTLLDINMNNVPMPVYEATTLQPQYFGQAIFSRYSPLDKFVPDIGRRIAFCRAKWKLVRAMNHHWFMARAAMQKWLSQKESILFPTINKMYDNIEYRKDKILNEAN